MLDAIGKGISIMELAWTVEDGRNVIEDIEYVHPKKLVWDSTTDELKVCTREYPSGVELPENKFVVHKYKAKSGHASRAGIMRVVSWMYLFKNYDIKDWVSFCEVFGMPLRLGKYDASASESDKKQLMEAIISLGTDAAGIVPSSTMIEFIESQKTTSVEIYEKLARYCDEQISKAILGQTLTSDSGGGSYAQSKTHNEVRHDLTVADAKSLAVTIRRDIIRPLVEFNYGSEANIPFFGFDCHEVEDQKEVVEIYKTLALVNSLDIEDISEGGNIMDLKELAKALGLPETATEEEIKKAVEDAAKAAEKLKEMDGKKPGEGDGKPGDGEPKPEGADMVANSTILSMLGLKADAKTEDVAASIMALKAGAPDTQAELLALKQRMAERDADEEVQKALKAGKITAAQSEWAKSYALKDMEGFKGFVDKAPVVVPQGKLDLKDAPAASNSDEVDVAILKNMGVSMEDVKKYNKKED